MWVGILQRKPLRGYKKQTVGSICSVGLSFSLSVFLISESDDELGNQACNLLIGNHIQLRPFSSGHHNTKLAFTVDTEFAVGVHQIDLSDTFCDGGHEFVAVLHGVKADLIAVGKLFLFHGKTSFGLLRFTSQVSV